MRRHGKRLYLRNVVVVQWAVIEERTDRICSHFARTGWCKFGSTCRFSHDTSDAKRVSQALRESDDKRSARTDRVCSFFSRTGHCRFGDRCRFVHVREQEVLAGVENDVDPHPLFMYARLRLDRFRPMRFQVAG